MCSIIILAICLLREKRHKYSAAVSGMVFRLSKSPFLVHIILHDAWFLFGTLSSAFAMQASAAYVVLFSKCFENAIYFDLIRAFYLIDRCSNLCANPLNVTHYICFGGLRSTIQGPATQQTGKLHQMYMLGTQNQQNCVPYQQPE